MRTSLYSLCIAIIAVAFLNGCDEIQSPYKRNVDDNNNNNNGTYIRKVFIEDYTGYRCGNCPRAAEEASRLLKTYDTNIVVLALHTGSIFARPFGSKFKQDFRTEAGEQLFTDFIGNAGQPNVQSIEQYSMDKKLLPIQDGKKNICRKVKKHLLHGLIYKHKWMMHQARQV